MRGYAEHSETPFSVFKLGVLNSASHPHTLPVVAFCNAMMLGCFLSGSYGICRKKLQVSLVLTILFLDLGGFVLTGMEFQNSDFFFSFFLVS